MISAGNRLRYTSKQLQNPVHHIISCWANQIANLHHSYQVAKKDNQHFFFCLIFYFYFGQLFESRLAACHTYELCASFCSQPVALYDTVRWLGQVLKQ